MLLVQNSRRQRRAADLTQQELDEKTGVAANFISDLERGVKNPSLDTVMRLAKGIGTTPDKLIMPVWEKVKKKL